MGLRENLQADIAEAFDDVDGLADAVVAFIGSRFVPGEYDPKTGQSGISVIYSGRGVFGGYSIQEVDDQHILRTDVKLIALQNEVTLDSDGTQAEPKIDDHINGLLVINVRKDPASATFSVQLRKT